MTVGRRQYNEAEMMQMQRDAEVRVREMQSRARKAAEEMGAGDLPPSANRNWSTNPGMRRPRNSGWQNQQPGRGGHNQQTQPPRQQPPKDTRPEEPGIEHAQQEASASPAALPHAPPRKDGTIIGDIMGALGLDEDYLLIIGLLLILINQRADTTLILALAYLLI